MKQRKTVIVILVCLLLVTAVFTLLHLSTRDQVPEGVLLVSGEGKEQYMDLSKLPLGPVSGIVVNGRGEEKTMEGQGISIADLLTAAGFDPAAPKQVTAVSEDEYSAEISAEEIAEGGKIYLLIEDGSARLVAFGDSNSRRNVKNVVKLYVS